MTRARRKTDSRESVSRRGRAEVLNASKRSGRRRAENNHFVS